MSRKNILTSVKMYQLTKVVEERVNSQEAPFDNWKQAARCLSNHMGHPVTRANIERAAENCHVLIDLVVKPTDHVHPFAKFAASYRELQARVEKLEQIIKPLVE